MKKTEPIQQYIEYDENVHEGKQRFSYISGVYETNENGICVKIDFTLNGKIIFCENLVDSNFLSEDFTGCNFHCVEFSNQKLKNIYFIKTNFKYTSFYEANLKNISFQESKLKDTNFTGSTLSDINFSGASLQNVNFCGSMLKNISFDGAVLNNINFFIADLRFVDTSKIQIVDNIKFKGAILTRAQKKDLILKFEDRIDLSQITLEERNPIADLFYKLYEWLQDALTCIKISPIQDPKPTRINLEVTAHQNNLKF